MGIVCADLFTTLDGVYQAPGGPDEDPAGGFPFGGWQGAYVDEESAEVILAGIRGMDALLLGRATYDIFAGYWPHQGENWIAAILNALPKYVVSSSMTGASWRGTTVLPDVDAVRSVRNRFHEVHVIGSGLLVRSLLGADLLDRLNLIVYPVTFGMGKRLLGDGVAVPASFRLTQPPRAFPSGAVHLVYDRVGVPVTGIDIGEI